MKKWKVSDLINLLIWRPISLLNVDYKIMAKIIANREKKVLTNIANSSQTGIKKIGILEKI